MKDEEKRRPEKSRVERGNLWKKDCTKCKKLVLKNRDDANKFNLAMDDENIDFNISGVPNAMVKTIAKH